MYSLLYLPASSLQYARRSFFMVIDFDKADKLTKELVFFVNFLVSD